MLPAPAAQPDLDRILACGFADRGAFLARYPDGSAAVHAVRKRDDLVSRYLFGMCGVMAVAIHRRTGWPIVAIVERPGDAPRHVACEDVDGGYVDARGRRLDAAELVRPYGGGLLLEATTAERVMRTFLRHPDLYDDAMERHLDRLLPDLPTAPDMLFI